MRSERIDELPGADPGHMEHSREILIPGRNCWRTGTARRVSFLIDGAAYFTAFVEAVDQARRAVYIAGWDINSRVALLRDNEEQIEKFRLHDFLNRTVSERADLEIHILIWDFAMIFALERELVPVFRMSWARHERIHFHMDDEHPLGASHHQKIVVVDDAVAFVGGFDLTKLRWDTPEHRADDPRRVDPDGRPYPPFHDVQIAVDGEAAAALGDLFRRRWERATGSKLVPPKTEGDAWPEQLHPDATNLEFGILRTEPSYKDCPEVKEIEQLHLDAISSARHHIYIENQYLTSSAVGRALKKRLAEEEGPEIVILVPFASSGWLEESTMDTGRALLLQHLKQADRFNRLRVYYPVVPGVEPASMTFHSKVMIVDDYLVRVGSSNLSNRSMGLDTECDVAFEAQDDEKVAASLAMFRNRLIAEHLGVTPEEIQECYRRTGSLIDTIEELRGSDRTLAPLVVEVPQWLTEIAPQTNPADPERPVNPEQLLRELLPEKIPLAKRFQLLKVGALIALLVGLAVAWRWGPLGEWIDTSTLARWASEINNSPFAPAFVIGAFVAGGFVLIPVTLLIAATALVFEPTLSIAYCLSGAVASATIMFLVGRRIGRESVRHLAGERVNRVSKRLARKGILTVAALRIVPIAPYSIANLVMGASHLSLKDFILGTIVGMAPGIVAMSLLGERLTVMIRNPGSYNLLLLGALFLIGVAGFVGLRHWFSQEDVDTE